jgi:hypothetical protein
MSDESNEYAEKNEEPKDDDVQGHRLAESNEYAEKPDVEGHMFENVENVENVE